LKAKAKELEGTKKQNNEIEAQLKKDREEIAKLTQQRQSEQQVLSEATEKLNKTK